MQSDRRTLAPLTITLLALGGCTAASEAPALVTDMGSLDAHVDRLVTLRGPLEAGKGCRILGVNVRTARRELEGRLVEATGVLVKHSFASTGSAFDSNQMPVGRYSLYESRSTSTRARVRPYATR